MAANSKWDIDRWVELLAQTPIAWFYPSLPSKALGLRPAEVMERLLHHVQDGKLNLSLEFRCPDCLTTLHKGSKNDFPTSCFCPKCDNDYEVSLEELYPIFSFNESYKNTVKKKTVSLLPRSYPSRLNNSKSLR